jgi:hypothetical protein
MERYPASWLGNLPVPSRLFAGQGTRAASFLNGFPSKEVAPKSVRERFLIGGAQLWPQPGEADSRRDRSGYPAEPVNRPSKFSKLVVSL